jgi:hypothetical protein
VLLRRWCLGVVRFDYCAYFMHHLFISLELRNTASRAAIQSCHAANATIAAVIVKVEYSITLFQNLFCLLVISCTNIAIFFFPLSLLSIIYCNVLLRVAVYTAVLCSYYWSSSLYSDMCGLLSLNTSVDYCCHYCDYRDCSSA